MSDKEVSINSLPRKDVRIPPEVGGKIRILRDNAACADVTRGGEHVIVEVDKTWVRIAGGGDGGMWWFMLTDEGRDYEVVEGPPVVIKPAAPATFVTKDSGKREEWSTGSRRDLATGKGRHDLLPAYPIKRLAQLYERGAAKYGDRNWEKGQPLSRYLQSGLRHFFDFLDGDRSEDHLIAVVWNIFAFLYTERQIRRGKLPKGLDDTGETDLPEMTT